MNNPTFEEFEKLANEIKEMTEQERTTNCECLPFNHESVYESPDYVRGFQDGVKLGKDSLRSLMPEIEKLKDFEMEFDKDVMIAEVPPELVRDAEKAQEVWNAAIDEVIRLIQSRSEANLSQKGINDMESNY